MSKKGYASFGEKFPTNHFSRIYCIRAKFFSNNVCFFLFPGLPSQYGLYSGLMDGLMYFFFGGCKDINVGPTAILALFVQPFVTTMGPAGAVLMTFISGTLIFIAGILHLGTNLLYCLNGMVKCYFFIRIFGRIFFGPCYIRFYNSGSPKHSIFTAQIVARYIRIG